MSDNNANADNEAYPTVLPSSGERQEADVNAILNYDFSLIQNFERLPREASPLVDAPQTSQEVMKLLKEFKLEDDPGIQEIRQRVRFVNWGNLHNIIHWTPSSWVRILGERTAARLCRATFLLSRLSFLDELVLWLEDAMDNPEGRYEFPMTRQASALFEQEKGEVIPARNWTGELRRHIRHAIDQLTAQDSSRDDMDTTIYADRSDKATASEKTDLVPVFIACLNGTEEESKASNGETTTQLSPLPDDMNGIVNVPPDLPVRRNPPRSHPPERQTTPPSSTPQPEAEDGEDGGLDKDEEDERRARDCRKKCILNAVLLVNILVALLALDYGLGIDIFPSDDSSDDVPTQAPTIPAPTAPPTTEFIWTQVGEDIFVSENGTNAFGWSVAINANGNTLAIGDPQGGGGYGRVYTYKLIEAENRFTTYGKDLQGDEIGCEFGNSTDLSDNADYLAVGARNRDNGRGQAMVFRYDDGTWKRQGRPLYGRNATNDDFGNAVSISSSGKIIAVGAAREDRAGIGLGENTGVVRVFRYDEDIRDWVQYGSDLSGKQGHEKFGFSLKLSASGEVLAVGAPFRHLSTSSQGERQWRGSVDVFQYDSEQKDWVQWGSSIVCTNHAERCGWSVDLNVNGRIMAVGAPVNDENGKGSGQVRVYEYDFEIKDWLVRGEPIPGERNRPGWFGNTVSLSSDGSKISTALWCDRVDILECDLGVRMFTYDHPTKKWNQLGPDLPGKTRYDPYSTSLAMAKDDTIVMTSVDLESEETVVRAHRPPV